MWLVTVALLPAAFFGIYAFGYYAGLVLLLSIAFSIITEAIILKMRKKPVSIDDGSGLINAIKWEVNSKRYEKINKGDIVSLVGRVNKWNETTQVTLGHINKIENPNFSLLHDSEIIFKITKGSIHSIPSDDDDTSFQEGGIISEEEFIYDKKKTTEKLFASKSNDEDDPQEKVFLFIEENSQTGMGTSLEDLNLKLQIPKNKLITYLGHLERASRIYQSEDNVYQSY